MKRRITILLAALLLTCGLSWAQQISWTAADQGYENGAVIESVTFDSNVSGTFDKGTNSNAPKYYATGTAIRCYGGNYFTISTSAGNLTSIAMTFSTGEGTNAITTDVGSYVNGTWSGEAQSVTFTIGGATGHRRIASFTISYSTAAATVATPTFNPASGTEFGDEGLQVSITCATEGVDIYYTLDGSEPDDESISYSDPISLTETTTIKAIAYDGDDNNSAVATATYTYVDPNAPGTENNPYTVAQARAAIDANAGTQGVYATGIVSAIPTAWSTQYNNITFNFVDNTGDTEFLQAYRCVSGTGVDASDVAVGDVVVVYGNLTKYQSTYEFAQNCSLVSLTHPTGYVEAPTFSPAAGTYDEAQNVTIECANTNATIYYTLDGTEPTNASTPYTTAINIATTTTIKAIAYVGANASTVTTAEYTIVPVANISSITEVGTSYVVKGTVVATNNRGFVMGDGTGYVYYYKNGTVSQSVGDMVKVSGTTGTYGQIIQFTNTATVTEATTSNYNGTPAATVITEVPDYTSGYHLSTYFEFEGELTKSNSSYFIALGEEQIQISYPTSAQGTALTALDGKTVHVKGYFTGINSSSKFTVMLESAEEVVSTEPVINADNITLAYDATSGEIEYTITNPIEGTTLNATCDAEWVSNIVVGESSITFNVTENEGEEDRTANITLTYTGAENKTVTVTQGHFVVDYATLPFSWDDTSTPTGITNHGVGTYSSSPYLKFDGAGDYIILKFNEEPGTLTFDIKGNPSNGVWSGTFKVQTSEDGETYTDLETYTNLTSTVQSERFDNLDENVRYIKWIYTEKSSGNVALGNIHLYEPGGGPALETYDLTVEPFENLEIYTFVENENEAALEGAGTIQVTEGDQVMLSITANEGYVIQSLMVDGVEHVNDIDDAATYTFNMPSHNVTISATAVEDVPPTPFEPATYTLATTIESGKIYIITSEVFVDEIYAMGGQNNNNRAAVAVDIQGTTVTVETDEVYEVVITLLDETTEDGDALYSIFDARNNGYLYAASSSSNYLRTKSELDDNGKWTIAFGDNGVAIKAQGNNTRNLIRYNGSSNIFSCYASGQGDVYLYVKEETVIVTQTVALSEGWNWVSLYVEGDPMELIQQLEEVLGDNGIQIESQYDGYTENIGDGYWWGDLDGVGIVNENMYLIEAAADCEVEMQGEVADPANHLITLYPEWTWIGFPCSEEVNTEVALSGLEAEDGDMIEAQDGVAEYLGDGFWWGIETLVPGEGYMYYSNGAEEKTFVFRTVSEEKALRVVGQAKPERRPVKLTVSEVKAFRVVDQTKPMRLPVELTVKKVK